METVKPQTKILKILLKNFTIKPTITLLAKEINMTRVGTWKILKKLEKNRLIILSKIGEGKTSMYSISLNWDNPLTEKNLLLILAEDAIKNQRWINNFAELKNKVNFLIIYGSIIHSPKKANDIDILAVVTGAKRFVSLDKIIQKIQKTQIKKIHFIQFGPEELKKELKNNNKAFIDAINKGIVLFGQEKFIKFIKEIRK